MSERRPSATTVIACLALFFAVAGGSAIALKGKNTVNSGDIKKGQVKNSDIAKNAVTTYKIKNDQVRAADIAADSVGGSELTQAEAFHKVGGTNEPPPGDGGEGDCIWFTAPTSAIRVAPAAFYKDPYGVVRLAGVIQAVDGTGGDGSCTGGSPAEVFEDQTAFILPADYRPPTDMLFWSAAAGTPILVVGSTAFVAPGLSIPAGSVIDIGATQSISLDGIDFRAAGTGAGLPRLSSRPISRREVLELLP